MRSLYTLAGLFYLSLFANCIHARKEPAEKYWQDVAENDKPMPQLVEGLIHASKVTSTSNKDSSDCHDSATFDVKSKDNKSYFTKDLEPRPSVTAYVDNLNPRHKYSFVREFEPRPSASAYVDNLNPINKNSFVREFEPRPSLSAYVDRPSATAYTNDVKPKYDMKDFEPRPNISASSDAVKPENDKSPRPNVSTYNDDVVGAKAEKAAYENDLESQPNASVYQD